MYKHVLRRTRHALRYHPYLKSSNPNHLINIHTMDKRNSIVLPTQTIKDKRNKLVQSVYINTRNVHDLPSLILLIQKYPPRNNVAYNLPIERFHKALPHLIQLQRMTGLESFKKKVLEQLVYYCQGLGDGLADYKHTVIYGNPGSGKSEIATILANIFSSIGVLPKNTVHKVTRADLVAGYLGQTAIKTKKTVEHAIGGVLFIDEAYSLGSKDNEDYFAVECIDTLCELLSFHRKNLMVVIAGYRKEIDERLFQCNIGLRSRFLWWYELPDYSPPELAHIFLKKITDDGWSVDTNHDTHIPNNKQLHLTTPSNSSSSSSSTSTSTSSTSITTNTDTTSSLDPNPHPIFKPLLSLFEEHSKYFRSNGRDVENLLTFCRIAHSTRIFADSNHTQLAILNIHDIHNGFKLHLDKYALSKQSQLYDIEGQEKEKERNALHSLYL